MVRTCHWPRCERRCLPHLLLCPAHWRLIPKQIRHSFWHSYRHAKVRVEGVEFRKSVASIVAWIGDNHHRIDARR